MLPLTFKDAVGLAPHHYIEIDNSGAFSGLSQMPQRLLVISVIDPEGERLTAEEGSGKSKGLSPKAQTASFGKVIDALDPLMPLSKFEEEAVGAAKLCAPGVSVFALSLEKAKLTSSETALKALEGILPEVSYTHIISLSEEKKLLDALKSLVAKRWNSSLQLDGHVFLAKYGSTQELSSFALERNDPHLSLIPLKALSESPGKWAASFAAICAANAHMPSRPYQNIVISGLSSEEGYKLSERDSLLMSGVATWRKVASDVVSDRLVTTYTKSPAGAFDPSFRDLETLQTLSFLRFDLREGLMRDFPRHMLARDDFPYEGPVVTPKVLKMWVVARFRKWQTFNLVQDPEGLFTKTLKVEVSESKPGKVDILMRPCVMGQYRQTQISMAFTL